MNQNENTVDRGEARQPEARRLAAMKLITQEISQRLPALYSAEHNPDPVVQVKFFTPWTSWTWYAIEFDGQDLFFGLVDGLDAELGYFSLCELESIRGPGDLRIERDLYFRPMPLSEVRKQCRGRRA